MNAMWTTLKITAINHADRHSDHNEKFGLCKQRNNFIVKQDINDDSVEAYIRSCGIESQTDGEVSKYEQYTKCFITLCRLIEERYGVLAGVSFARV